MSDIKRRRRSGRSCLLVTQNGYKRRNFDKRHPTKLDKPASEMERSQLMEALNTFSVEVGFECRIDLDGETKA